MANSGSHPQLCFPFPCLINSAAFSDHDSLWLEAVSDLDYGLGEQFLCLEPGFVQSSLHAEAETIERHEPRHQVPAGGDVQGVCGAEEGNPQGICDSRYQVGVAAHSAGITEG